MRKKRKEVIETAKNLRLDDDPTEAIVLIDDYLSKYDSKDIDLLLLKGGILEMQLEYDQAIRVYRKVLRIDKDNSQALIDIGDCYYSTDCKSGHQKAIRYYNRAIKLIESGKFYWNKEDEFIDAVHGKAEALLDLNRPMGALKCIVYGLQKYPTRTLLASSLQKAQERYETYQVEKNEQKKKRKRENLRLIK